MPLHLLGINHRTAPLDIRERVVFDMAALPAALDSLVRLSGVSEGVILSTCNRTEIYVQDQGDGEGLMQWLRHYLDLSEEVIECLYTLEDQDAARHLFAVACGLDSVVLGEPQILGQLKTAHRQADARGAIGSGLNRLFQSAFATAKQVRSETGIGANPVSVAYAAVMLGRNLFPEFSERRALLVGAGETVELVARHLHRQGLHQMTVANRNLNRAAELAAKFNASAVTLDELEDNLLNVDLVVTATASAKSIISRDMLERVLRKRKHAPMFLVDLGVPRDIDPAARELSDAYLYTVDDLEHVVAESLRSRRSAALHAEQLIDYAVEQYERQLNTLQAVPTIRAVREETERVRDETLAQARRLLETGRDPDEVLAYLAHTLTQKFLHAPSASLRQAGEETDEALIEAAARLFGVDKRQAGGQ